MRPVKQIDQIILLTTLLWEHLQGYYNCISHSAKTQKLQNTSYSCKFCINSSHLIMSTNMDRCTVSSESIINLWLARSEQKFMWVASLEQHSIAMYKDSPAQCTELIICIHNSADTHNPQITSSFVLKQLQNQSKFPSLAIVCSEFWTHSDLPEVCPFSSPRSCSSIIILIINNECTCLPCKFLSAGKTQQFNNQVSLVQALFTVVCKSVVTAESNTQNIIHLWQPSKMTIAYTAERWYNNVCIPARSCTCCSSIKLMELPLMILLFIDNHELNYYQ